MKKSKKITLFFGISTISILLIYLLNKIIFIFSTMKELLFSGNSNFYNWRFGKIFYTKRGTGSPILLVHDTSSLSSDYEWKEIISDLSKSHTVYTLDLIGCGRSDKPKITYTNYIYVQLISEFVKNVVKQKVDVIVTGKSSSSVIMASYIDAQLFNNLLLVNPENLSSVNKCPRYKHKLLRYIIDSPILGTLIYNILMNKQNIKDSFKKKYFFNVKKIRSKYIGAYSEAAHMGGSSAKFMYSSICCNYMNTNFIHALKEINHNIYIIGGEKEKDIIEIFDQYTKCNSSIETVLIKESKHLPQLENPTEFYQIIEVFL